MELQPESKELAIRKNDGLTVTLWWVKNTLATYVTVLDTKVEPPVEHMIDVVPPAKPNDVFEHPFRYLPVESQS